MRDRGADGVNLDFEPIVSTYADEFTALVRSVRAELNKVATGYQLTFDTTGWIGNYPIEAATAAGRRGRGRDHGLRLQGRLVEPGRVGRADRRPRLRHRRHDPGLHRPHPGVQGHPRRPVLRPRLVDRHVRPRLAKNISGTKYGASTTVVYTTARELRRRPRPASGTRSRASPGPSTGARTARRRTAASSRGASSTTTTRKALGLKYDLVNRYNLRGAGIWALGYDGTRTELYSVLKAKFITDTVPPVISAAVAQRDRSCRRTATGGWTPPPSA